MSILIESKTAAETSGEIRIFESASLFVSSDIAANEDCVIEIKSGIDTWRDTLKRLTTTEPVLNIIGPIVIRISKPVSAQAYGVEIIQKIDV